MNAYPERYKAYVHVQSSFSLVPLSLCNPYNVGFVMIEIRLNPKPKPHKPQIQALMLRRP